MSSFNLSSEYTLGYAAFGISQTTGRVPAVWTAWLVMDMSYCKRECVRMGQRRVGHGAIGGFFCVHCLMRLCRSSRIAVVSSHRGIFWKWALVGHGDSDRSLFLPPSVSSRFMLLMNFIADLDRRVWAISARVV